MKLALCQMSMSENETENLAKGLAALREAAAEGADLILYPELQLHRFFPQYEKLDVGDKLLTQDHPIVRQFQEACRTHHIMAAPNFYLRELGGCFDTTLLIGSDGALIGRQKMVHIAQAHQFYEQDYYTPATTAFRCLTRPTGGSAWWSASTATTRRASARRPCWAPISSSSPLPTTRTSLPRCSTGR